MHMADALLSPEVGASFLAASLTALVIGARRLQASLQEDSQLVALMGVLGAFVFAAQMINFSIPGTGSSGHLGGGMLLAILLGPWAGLIVIASVLLVQALFFADGGLLAWGANVFNLGVISCLILYPLVYCTLAGDGNSRARVTLAAVLACTLSTILGAAGIALETAASGITRLPLPEFLALMIPIHLVIGLVEGLVTAGVLTALAQRPGGFSGRPLQAGGRGIIASFILAALLTGGVLSWLASEHPDGLEWSVERLRATSLLEEAPVGTLHRQSAQVQQLTSVLPDYELPNALPSNGVVVPGVSIAGIVGSVVTLALVALVALMLRRPRRNN
ncbi:energy-coupling factor ABC transporter permease [Crenobacter intestini]|uniref:Cobalamin biosynthesis protein CbiM n=1 Tax=Crenobacter intestini TaxID=2563443 RepID=A0A4T0UPQ0_9NEIS|nr:energy-coupling factor ABC transporter permease [Crenobacter intestini]TIC80526.1 cobalamin biosynthesis protein CbiM [Crenobacter intestini]